jgi:GNAT superfamily N-acetyltransferase
MRKSAGAMPTTATIIRFADVADKPDVVSGIADVFFQSSNTQSFADAAARAAFHERWLSRYLNHDPQWAYVAMSECGDVAGYLVASLDDPAMTPRFADNAHFLIFKDLTRRFPAHLHVNLAPAYRSHGLGSQLVSQFLADATRAGAPGVHIMTSRGARNVGFYGRNGFHELGATGQGAQDVVFLAREL